MLQSGDTVSIPARVEYDHDWKFEIRDGKRVELGYSLVDVPGFTTTLLVVTTARWMPNIIVKARLQQLGWPRQGMAGWVKDACRAAGVPEDVTVALYGPNYITKVDDPMPELAPIPHTDERGHVLIPHPVGTTGLRCQVGCGVFSDGVRHRPDCPKVIAWRAALATTPTPKAD